MFKSATVKLTGWYLLILMVISLSFSIVIYQISVYEVNTRLESLQSTLFTQPSFVRTPIDPAQIVNMADATNHLISGLFFANLSVLVFGGIGSFLLARRTLKPIEDAHEAQSRFTSDASHELRTPLASMRAELEVTLRDPSTTKKEYQELLRSNLEEVVKLTKLSEMLLNLSRLDHDKLEQTSVNLTQMINDIIKQFNVPDDRMSVTAKKDTFVVGNDIAINELISILIDNSLKYSPADSLVVISLSTRNRQARFEITNTGPGIDSTVLPHIFDRFYRGDVSRTKSAKSGYGLGLALAKKIVQLHDGELSASSAPGHATTFTFMLPVSQSRPSRS